jgi:hypothetical protein
VSNSGPLIFSPKCRIDVECLTRGGVSDQRGYRVHVDRCIKPSMLHFFQIRTVPVDTKIFSFPMKLQCTELKSTSPLFFRTAITLARLGNGLIFLDYVLQHSCFVLKRGPISLEKTHFHHGLVHMAVNIGFRLEIVKLTNCSNSDLNLESQRSEDIFNQLTKIII